MNNEKQETIFSIARKNKKSRESLTVSHLFPQELVGDIQPLIQFLEAYYDWMNENKRYIENGTSDLRNDVKMQHIEPNLFNVRNLDDYPADVLDNRNIGRLFSEIASKFPQKDLALDYRTVLKNIETLYAQKGSEDAVKSFFRVVYGSNSSVYYPWNDVLIASAGEWDGTRFLSNKGFLSDTIHLQDSNYWQRFSYDIKTEQPEVDWRNVFETLLHPAGFKVFSSLFILIFSDNKRMPRSQLGILEFYFNTFLFVVFDENLSDFMKVHHVLTLLMVLLIHVANVTFGGYQTFRRSTFFNPSLLEEIDTLVFSEIDDINKRNSFCIGSFVESFTD